MTLKVHVLIHDDLLDDVVNLLGGDPTMAHIQAWVNRACREQWKRDTEFFASHYAPMASSDSGLDSRLVSNEEKDA